MSFARFFSRKRLRSRAEEKAIHAYYAALGAQSVPGAALLILLAPHTYHPGRGALGSTVPTSRQRLEESAREARLPPSKRKKQPKKKRKSEGKTFEEAMEKQEHRYKTTKPKHKMEVGLHTMERFLTERAVRTNAIQAGLDPDQVVHELRRSKGAAVGQYQQTRTEAEIAKHLHETYGIPSERVTSALQKGKKGKR